MKKILILFIAALMISPGCKQEEPNPIEGAWDLIYVRNIENDSIVSEFPLTYQGSDMKIWTRENWCFVGRYKMDTIVEDNYGGGTYSLNGNIYVENIIYHKEENYIGQKIMMLMTVRNDTLIQIWPVDEQGVINKSNCTVERYIRLK